MLMRHRFSVRSLLEAGPVKCGWLGGRVVLAHKDDEDGDASADQDCAVQTWVLWVLGGLAEVISVGGLLEWLLVRGLWFPDLVAGPGPGMAGTGPRYEEGSKDKRKWEPEPQ